MNLEKEYFEKFGRAIDPEFDTDMLVFISKVDKEAYQRGLAEMKAAAIGAVPGIDTTDAYTVASGWNGCREATLTALRALPTNEQER